MRPSSKIGPVMAGPTGPVPPGLSLYIMAAFFNYVISIRIKVGSPQTFKTEGFSNTDEMRRVV